MGKNVSKISVTLLFFVGVMSSHMRAACSEESTSSAGSCTPSKKRGLRTTTVDKWIAHAH